MKAKPYFLCKWVCLNGCIIFYHCWRSKNKSGGASEASVYTHQTLTNVVNGESLTCPHGNAKIVHFV